MGKTIGIDLGTTNSCVAVIEGGTTTVIHNREGSRTLPSAIAFGENGEIQIGIRAKRQAVTNPTGTIVGAKRLLGRKHTDENLQEWATTVPFEVVPAKNGDAWIRVGTKDYSPQEISAFILEEVKTIAEEYIGDEVTEAVVTVPAYFNDCQRQATKEAGRIAGLNISKIINEPTAAALGYGFHKEKDQKIAVFDLGGGTFDVTILQMTGGVFEVLASNGDTFLGGDDFDQRLIRHLVTEFQVSTGIDLTSDAGALARTKEAAETAKRELSTSTSTVISLPFICAGEDGPLHIQYDSFERSLFDDLTRDLVDRLVIPCLTALEDAGMAASDLDQVLLVGGMTRVPAVQEKVFQIFGKQPSKGANPDEIVAVGAATQSAIISGAVRDVVLLDVTPHSLGVKVVNDEMSVVIPKNTSIPTSEKKVFATTRDQQEFVTIEIYQGEADLVRENTYLGMFSLGNIPLENAGDVVVEVNFVIDSDGVVRVTAREMQTGKEASVTVTASSGLSNSQIEQIGREHRQRATA